MNMGQVSKPKSTDLYRALRGQGQIRRILTIAIHHPAHVIARRQAAVAGVVRHRRDVAASGRDRGAEVAAAV